MKILLISGHGAGDSGAVGCGYKEADLTRTGSSILEGKFKSYDCKVERYPVSRNAYEDNKLGRMQRSFIDYDLVIELHFNAFNGSAHGEEVLYRPAQTKALAAAVSKAIASFGFTNRGAKQRTDLMNMNTCNRLGIPYILIETCFIDNKDDMKRYHAGLYDIWGAVCEAVANYYHIKKLASTGKPVETEKSKPAKKETKYTATFPVLPEKGYLTKGDTGTQVKRLQKFLNWYGNYGLEIDGSFGPATLKAVKAYQKSEKLTVDGFFGPASLKAAKAVRK